MINKKQIFDFNHIDRSSSTEWKQELINLYAFYHKQCYINKAMYNHFKKMDMALKMTSGSLVVSGSIAGCITPIVLASITGSGVLVNIYVESKNYRKKQKWQDLLTVHTKAF